MSADTLWSLVMETVTTPRTVAARLIGWHLPREALLTAFALVVVLNALVFGALNLQSVSDNPLVALAHSPVTYALLLAMAVGVMIVAMTVIGRMMGGQGQLADMAIVVIWLQALRALAQSVLGLAVLLGPNFAFLLAVVASVIGVWILLNFVEAVHRFGRPFKALLTLLIAAVATSIVFGMAVNATGLTDELTDGLAEQGWVANV